MHFHLQSSHQQCAMSFRLIPIVILAEEHENRDDERSTLPWMRGGGGGRQSRADSLSTGAWLSSVSRNRSQSNDRLTSGRGSSVRRSVHLYDQREAYNRESSLSRSTSQTLWSQSFQNLNNRQEIRENPAHPTPFGQAASSATLLSGSTSHAAQALPGGSHARTSASPER